MSRDVIIIGGGASGMMAALAAAENGCRVTLLERQSRVGRKLLATGNGRCNLTNHNVSPARYHGGDGFCAYALDAFDVGGYAAIFRLAGASDGRRGQRARLSHEQHGGQRAGCCATHWSVPALRSPPVRRSPP